jgi:L-malate glycosyltransferase
MYLPVNSADSNIFQPEIHPMGTSRRHIADKTRVLILVDELKPAGAEILAVNMAIGLSASNRYIPMLCATRIGGELEERLRASGINYFVLQRDKPYRIYKLLVLARIIRQQGIKIIHAHKSGSSLWGGIFGKLGRVDAVFAHIHGRRPDWKSSIAEKFLGKLCDKIITVSDYEKRRLIAERRIDPSKIVTVYNGVRLSKYKTLMNSSLKSRLGIKVETPVVGIFAELRPEKNHEVFLRAAKELLVKRKLIHFLIVGDGERRKHLEGYANDLGITNNCTFTGFIRNVPDVLSIIDVGVLCSEREALPLTILEYMASSKPIVATAVGGIPEAVLHGFNGLLTQPNDSSALAANIEVLLSNKHFASVMGDNGLTLVKDRFSEGSLMNRIEDLYNQQLSELRSIAM